MTTSNIRFRKTAQHPASQFLQFFLHRAKMLNLFSLSITYYNISLAFQDRFYQLRYILPLVLIISICIDDNISAKPQAGIQSRKKGAGKSLVANASYDVVNTDFLCHLNSSINAPIINNKDFHLVNTLYFAGDILNGFRKGLFLVIAWYLDYEFHEITLMSSWGECSCF